MALVYHWLHYSKNTEFSNTEWSLNLQCHFFCTNVEKNICGGQTKDYVVDDHCERICSKVKILKEWTCWFWHFQGDKNDIKWSIMDYKWIIITKVLERWNVSPQKLIITIWMTKQLTISTLDCTFIERKTNLWYCFWQGVWSLWVHRMVVDIP